MSSSLSPVFSSLPQRPPTPPKDRITSHVDDALRFLEEGHQSPTKEHRETEIVDANRTPPSRSSTDPQQQGSGTGKRVDFSPWPTYHNSSQAAGQHLSPRSTLLKQLPQARGSRPLKSILKPSNEPLPLTPDDMESKLSYFSPDEPESFGKMLQSVLRQLASQNRSARLDAYLVLNGSLKTYDAMPDPRALTERMTLLTQFLARDMAWRDAEGGLDSNIVTQALHLTCAILSNSQTSRALDDDFRAFLVDRSISVLEQTNIAKAIMKNHMFLLSSQRFHPTVMTASRVDRIVTSLKTIEERCSGNSAVAARLVIYQRLVEQAAATMLSKMHDWLEIMLHGLLSSNKEIRIRAIEACSQAGFILGAHHQASKTLHEVLETEIEEGQTYGDFFNSRLLQMISDSAVGPDVPRIWAAIILFFRCKRRPIHKWPKFRVWLTTIQRCFNSSELAIKQQATLAWNKLIFTVMPDASTTEVCRSMLKVPISASIEKPGQDRHSQQLRQLALDGYFTLLHYALRPELSFEELDGAWDMYVQPVLAVILKSSSKGPQQVCRILYGLFSKSSGTWNVNAAMEGEAIKPEELPRLDIRWVRSRLQRILRVFEPVLVSALRSSTFIARANDAWTLLWQSVAEAGSQEVKTSNELKAALAQVTNLFRRIWRSGQKLLTADDTSFWFQKFHELVRITVESLGSGPFVEDILSRNTDDEVEAAPTPSQRLSKSHDNTHSPLVFLFALYYQPPSGVQADESYSKSASWLIHFLSAAKSSAIEKLSLLTQIVQDCPRLHALNVPSDITQQLWSVIATHAIELLDIPKNAPPHEIQSVGIGIQHALNIMSKGLQVSTLYEENLTTTISLYDAMCHAARTCGGGTAVVLAVVEPVCKIALDNIDTLPIHFALQLATHLLDSGVWPKNRQTVEHARKALWPFQSDPTRSASFEPFKYVYALVIEVSQRAYGCGLRDINEGSFATFTNSLAAFIHKCPHSQLTNALQQSQVALAIWAQDPQRLFFPLSRVQSSNSGQGLSRQRVLQLSPHVTSFWSQVLEMVRPATEKGSDLLKSVDLLMIAGFSSPSRDIVNSSIKFWNDTFGAQSTLEYPSKLLPILRARSAETELILPSFPPSNNGGEVASLPPFAESQSEISPRPSPSVIIPRRRVDDAFRVHSPLIRSRKLGTADARVEGTSSFRHPRSKRPLKSGSATKPKLRHDDSQIDFEAIISSPLPFESSSQNLTDHQEDVRAKQHVLAQMFPELSSSPNPQTIVIARSIPKKLDFSSSSQPAEDDIPRTPVGPADTNPMSDDLPSSPTPRSIVKPGNMDDSEADENDPPSSPPQCDDQASSVSPFKSVDMERANTPPIVEHEEFEARGSETPDQFAEERQERLPHQDLPSIERQPNHAAIDERDEGSKTSLIEAVAEKDVQDALHSPSCLRSPIGKSQQSNASKDDSQDLSQGSQRITRKRKRAHGTVYTAKPRRKSARASVSDAAVTQEQDASEDDEIVVQPRRASLAETGAEKEDQQPSPSRARKSQMKDPEPETSPAIVLPSAEARPKRTASALSDAGSSRRLRGSAAKDELAPSKVLKEGEAHDVTTTRSQTEQAKVKRGADRQDTAVINSAEKAQSVMPTLGAPEDHNQYENDVGEANGADSASPDRQLTQEYATSVKERPIAQPHSIIARLRGVLADCKSMIFGRQEERELDDVLFELRQEVHEAARRGDGAVTR